VSTSLKNPIAHKYIAIGIVLNVLCLQKNSRFSWQDDCSLSSQSRLF